MLKALTDSNIREALLPSSAPSLPVRLQRYIRGRAEWVQLRKADCIVVSFGKSGRTWLRVMLSRYYQLRWNLPSSALLMGDNLHQLHSAVPIFHFTHDNYLADYTGHRSDKSDYHDLPVLLLVRDPRDTAVSQYFQWKYRMSIRKKWINGYPIASNLSLMQFALNDAVGIPRIIRFLNDWADDLAKIPRHHLLSYERLRAEQSQSLCGVLNFLGEEPTADELSECVEFSSVDSMRRFETAQKSNELGSRLRPRDPLNPDSFKVRRAKVGGYRDYFSPEELATVNSLLAGKLSPIFGYS